VRRIQCLGESQPDTHPRSQLLAVTPDC